MRTRAFRPVSALVLERALHEDFTVAHHFAAAGEDALELEVLGEEAGVGAGARLDDAVALDAEGAGDVRGREREGLFDRHVVIADETDGFLEVSVHAAHAEAVLASTSSARSARLVRDNGGYRVVLGNGMSLNEARAAALNVKDIIGSGAFAVQK